MGVERERYQSQEDRTHRLNLMCINREDTFPISHQNIQSIPSQKTFRQLIAEKLPEHAESITTGVAINLIEHIHAR